MMTFIASVTLFAVMTALAALPSSSVALVVTRSATLGLRNGISVSAGIVLGDLVFVVLAILGMSALAEVMGTFFMFVRYIAGAYLIWLGVTLIRANEGISLEKIDNSKSSILASFFSGFFLTLGDVKAILFYASLFPCFVDLSNVTPVDIAIIGAITVIGVGGVKVLYAFFARQLATKLSNSRSQKYIKKGTGGVLTGVGAYLIYKS